MHDYGGHKIGARAREREKIRKNNKTARIGRSHNNIPDEIANETLNNNSILLEVFWLSNDMK